VQVVLWSGFTSNISEKKGLIQVQGFAKIRSLFSQVISTLDIWGKEWHSNISSDKIAFGNRVKLTLK